MEKVLIAGISGAVGRLLARRLLADVEVCGADPASWDSRPPRIPHYRVDLRKREFEDVFRTERPTAVVHLGFVRDFRGDPGRRHDVNVRGTQKLLEHCARYEVRKVVVVSSGTVYGAQPDNPFFMDEDHPLSASRDYPEIRDLVEVDTLASGFLWKAAHIRTAVLRPVHVLGPLAHSMMADYLRLDRPPTLMGFDPVMQFIHEEDLVEAIARTLELGLSGVYNVTGPGEVPLHTAIRETGGSAIPIPEPLMRAGIRRLFSWKLVPWPVGAFDYIKYPVTLSSRRFVEATGFEPLFGLEETFRGIRG